MQRCKDTHDNAHFSPFITLLVFAGILFASTACDQGPCDPQAPVLATSPIRPLNQAFKSTFTCLSQLADSPEEE